MIRSALFTALLLCGFTAAAQVSTPAAAKASADQGDVAVVGAGSATSEAAKLDEQRNDRNCLQHTGSRLIRTDRKGRKCAPVAGRAYNQDDIRRTGATDVGDALRRLDPAVR